MSFKTKRNKNQLLLIKQNKNQTNYIIDYIYFL